MYKNEIVVQDSLEAQIHTELYNRNHILFPALTHLHLSPAQNGHFLHSILVFQKVTHQMATNCPCSTNYDSLDHTNFSAGSHFLDSRMTSVSVNNIYN